MMRRWTVAIVLLSCESRPSSSMAALAAEAAAPPASASAEPAGGLSSAQTSSELTPSDRAKPAPSAASPLKGKELSMHPPDLAELNRWATDAGVRQDIAVWAAHGLPIAPDVKTSIAVDYNRQELPDGATAVVVQDGYADDSIRGNRFILKFSRKPCPSCATGMTPWWLWSLETTQRCWPGRGHQDYSKELCR